MFFIQVLSPYIALKKFTTTVMSNTATLKSQQVSFLTYCKEKRELIKTLI